MQIIEDIVINKQSMAEEIWHPTNNKKDSANASPSISIHWATHSMIQYEAEEERISDVACNQYCLVLSVISAGYMQHQIWQY